LNTVRRAPVKVGDTLEVGADSQRIDGLPYFSDTYYFPLKRTFGLSNTQIGVLSGTFGFASLLSYAPGGWLADRYPARKLMSIALVISAMGGFIFARIPPFGVCVALYALW